MGPDGPLARSARDPPPCAFGAAVLAHGSCWLASLAPQLGDGGRCLLASLAPQLGDGGRCLLASLAPQLGGWWQLASLAARFARSSLRACCSLRSLRGSEMVAACSLRSLRGSEMVVAACSLRSPRSSEVVAACSLRSFGDGGCWLASLAPQQKRLRRKGLHEPVERTAPGAMQPVTVSAARFACSSLGADTVIRVESGKRPLGDMAPRSRRDRYERWRRFARGATALPVPSGHDLLDGSGWASRHAHLRGCGLVERDARMQEEEQDARVDRRRRLVSPRSSRRRSSASRRSRVSRRR